MSAFLSKAFSLLRRAGHLVGVEIRPNNLNHRDDLRLSHFMRQFKVELILDVGANSGQFANRLFRSGYQGQIVSFEALPAAHAKLALAASKKPTRWRAAPRCAVSDANGVANFNVTKADTSSSLLTPSSRFISATPSVAPQTIIEVPTARLDDLIDAMKLPLKSAFLKLDVQGAEPLVLAGANTVLASAKGVMVELSLNPLYDGQAPAYAVLGPILSAGFQPWDVYPVYREPSQRLMQVDLVCFHPDR